MNQILVVIVCCVMAAVIVTLIGLAVIGAFVQRSRQRAEGRLDDIHSRVLQLAVALSDQTKAEGYEARLRLIRAANAAMNAQQSNGRHH